MPKRIIVLGANFLALAILPVARCAAAANPDDAVVDHCFSAIRDDNFNAATQHFNAMRQADELSAHKMPPAHQAASN